MNDTAPPSDTTSQERFVVVLALLAGLALFAWLLPKSPVRHRLASAEAAPSTPRSTEDTWNHPDFPDASTSRIDDLEGRLADIESALGAKLDDLQVSTATASDALQAKIDRLVREIRSHEQRLAELEKQPSRDESARLVIIQRIRILESQLGRLRNDTAQSRLFVEDGEHLGGKASELFRRLRTLPETDPAALEAEYSRISEEFLSHPAIRVKYSVAESEVPANARPRIEQLTTGFPEGTFFLVAGYADQTGDPAANRVLSSRRASNVAEALDRTLKAGQAVRAIYLGQTSRFGADPENRVVEIWAIQP